ncbi:CGG triplet repeat-binding protein 1 [Trichinella spiralis]|uniref:CGG triplet repeat-binding protein 1 n=1 Tax=Trichinella spiralis TaxID=6334 RepID=A0A0V1BWP4_TRISP|nr:CGG triplet repeat-binding protein 1 [Trichinella spiralis]
MPKVKSKPSKKLIDLVNEYGSDILSTDNTVLFCKACGKTINHEKKYFVYQHLQTAKHKSATEKMKTESKQACLLNTFVADSSSKSQFPTELCMAFIDAGIPLWKLENKSLRSFLEKYTKQHIPSESSLRKHYIDNNFNNVMDRVRREVAYNKIWISIDETIDPVGRFVANVVIGTLEADQPSKEYLLTSEVLEKSNSSTIAQLFTSSLAVLWPEGIRHENVLLFVTDAAPYMKKAAGALKVLFPNMLHLTCLAHGLHRIAEHIRCLFPDVDRLISNMKKVFLKAPSRVQLFKEIAPEIPLPPQPVLTRWGTWLSAVFYYAANFKKIQEIISCFEEEESTAVKIVHEIMQKESLRCDLIFITSNFTNFVPAITYLEKRSETLVDRLQAFDEVIDNIHKIPGIVGEDIKSKCDKVISANKDLKEIKSIAEVLKGNSNAQVIGMNIESAVCFKYAPVTSAEVERSFSQLKYILSDRRHSLTPDNLKKMLVIMCNQTR